MRLTTMVRRRVDRVCEHAGRGDDLALALARPKAHRLRGLILTAAERLRCPGSEDDLDLREAYQALGVWL